MTQQPVSPPNAPGKEHSNALFTLVLIRGIAALVLGMALFLSPGLTGRKLAIFFVITVGVWMIFDGGLSIAAGIKEKKLKLPVADGLFSQVSRQLLRGLAPSSSQIGRAHV